MPCLGSPPPVETGVCAFRTGTSANPFQRVSRISQAFQRLACSTPPAFRTERSQPVSMGSGVSQEDQRSAYSTPPVETGADNRNALKRVPNKSIGQSLALVIRHPVFALERAGRRPSRHSQNDVLDCGAGGDAGPGERNHAHLPHPDLEYGVGRAAAVAYARAGGQGRVICSGAASGAATSAPSHADAAALFHGLSSPFPRCRRSRLAAGTGSSRRPRRSTCSGDAKRPARSRRSRRGCNSVRRPSAGRSCSPPNCRR